MIRRLSLCLRGVSFQLAWPVLRKLGGYATFCLLVCLFACQNSAGETKRLTTDGRIKTSPVFMNSDELVYVDFEKPEQTMLKVLKLSDGSIQRFHPKATTQELEPAFSPDGRHCVFLKATGTFSVTLVIRDEQANKDFEIPPGGGFCGFRSPAFSPDGKRVVYSFADNGFQDLYSVNAEAKDRQQLTKNSGMNYYSRDGKRILFGSTRHGNYELYSMNADATDVVRLTDNPFQDVRPQFSPDGQRIAFTSNRDQNFEIYMMHADGSNVRRVTEHPERDDYAVWHPNGKRLIVVAERDGRHDLYSIPVE